MIIYFHEENRSTFEKTIPLDVSIFLMSIEIDDILKTSVVMKISAEEHDVSEIFPMMT